MSVYSAGSQGRISPNSISWPQPTSWLRTTPHYHYHYYHYHHLLRRGRPLGLVHGLGGQGLGGLKSLQLFGCRFHGSDRIPNVPTFQKQTKTILCALSRAATFPYVPIKLLLAPFPLTVFFNM